jgi:hypothetical protein
MHPKLRCVAEIYSNSHNRYYPMELLEMIPEENDEVEEPKLKIDENPWVDNYSYDIKYNPSTPVYPVY